MHKLLDTLQSKLAAVAIFSAVTLSLGAPVIEVETSSFDFGAIEEGSLKIVKHEFAIKNTGDEPLKIEKLRPG